MPGYLCCFFLFVSCTFVASISDGLQAIRWSSGGSAPTTGSHKPGSSSVTKYQKARTPDKKEEGGNTKKRLPQHAQMARLLFIVILPHAWQPTQSSIEWRLLICVAAEQHVDEDSVHRATTQWVSFSPPDPCTVCSPAETCAGVFYAARCFLSLYGTALQWEGSVA